MPEPGPRIKALETAVEAARGHLDEGLLADAALTVERATGRLRLPAEHTIVAIAGSTGSGKSTTFNLLAGAELSVSGAQRPTTSQATALVWSEEDVSEILGWLGVPPARQHRRADLDPRPPRHRLPEGLVLLDLPDHDSVETAHHREAERVVALADLLIWVVDPQKYADAAIHRRFLRPLAGHRDVTMVVLNHLDTVPEERRADMLRDLRRVLVADGIRDPRILGTSAREGLGTDELRTAVRRRVEERPNVALRVEADVRTAAGRLLEAAGDAPTELPPGWVGDLERRVADAAGVPAAAARAERGADPGLRVGPVDRPAVDTAVRAFADRLCVDLTDAWAAPLRSAATRGLAETDDRLDAELAALRFPDQGAGVARVLGLARWGCAAGAVLSALLLLVSGLAVVPLVVLAAGAVAAHLAGHRAVTRAAARRGAEVEDACRAVVARVLRAQVVDPVRVELASYGRFRRAVDGAAR
ncbi:GTPase [Nocardioides sp. LML1-1-1.1]|uniref:GTPase n=1 Tax=Nocardioides sp. LML1-1-1.1 TaxID=3135248 RepID=UPI0034178FF0